MELNVIVEESTNGAAGSNEVVQKTEPMSSPLPEPATPLKPQKAIVIQALNSPAFHENMMMKPLSGPALIGRHDHYLKLSYVLTACFVCCCAWTSVLFTLPAIYFAKLARRAEVDRNTYLMIRNERISLVLNIGGMLAYIALFVAIITVIIVMEGQKIMAYEPQS